MTGAMSWRRCAIEFAVPIPPRRQKMKSSGRIPASLLSSSLLIESEMNNPEALETLLHQARKYAEFSMRNIGHVPPTMLAMTPEGTLTFLPDGLEDEKAKTSFANTARMICVGYGATAVVMILESWATFAKQGKRLDDTSPSEAMDRKEFVVLMGETAGKKTTEFLPILRTDAGGFFGFGEFDSSGLEGFQGRFAEMLPPIKPDKQMREMAQMLLQAMGVTKNLLQPKHGRN